MHDQNTQAALNQRDDAATPQAPDDFDFASLARQQVRGCRAAYGRMLQHWAQDVLMLRSQGILMPCWRATEAQEFGAVQQAAPAIGTARLHQPVARAAGHQRAA